MILISEKEKFFDPRKPFQSARPETHEEWQARMGGEVLAVVRSGLYLDFRFLDQALSALTPTADERCGVLATDGTILCYQPSALLRLYQKNPKYLNRLYLHTVFHCIFRHLWLRGRRDARLWSLACDIAVENVINELALPDTQTTRAAAQTALIGQLKEELTVLNAEKIYRYFLDRNLSKGEIHALRESFLADDHDIWYIRGKSAPEGEGEESGSDTRRAPDQTGSGSPNSASSAAICWLIAVWVMKLFCAPRVMLPVCATARKYANRSNFKGVPPSFLRDETTSFRLFYHAFSRRARGIVIRLTSSGGRWYNEGDGGDRPKRCREGENDAKIRSARAGKRRNGGHSRHPDAHQKA